MTTVKTQLDQTLVLFEDLCEALGRIEDRLQVLEKTSGGSSIDGLSELSHETNDLRTSLISLRQSLDNSVATDIGQFLSALKYLQASGLPDLLDQVKNLNVGVSALSTQLPQIEKATNALESIRKNSEDAGNFARHFHEPMSELLGRGSDGSYQEGKFILRNALRAFFSITGRDDFGRPKEKTLDPLKVIMEHYLSKTYRDPDGEKRPILNIILESIWAEVRANPWTKVFKALVLVIFTWWILPSWVSTARDIVKLASEVKQILPKTTP